MKITLEDKHRKLLKGKPVQLSARHIAGGAIEGGRSVDVKMSDAKMKALLKALKQGKGARLSLTDAEIDGSGLRDFFKKAGKTLRKSGKAIGKFYKDNLKEHVGPLIKKGLKTALDAGVVALSTAQPELAPALAVLDEKLGDKLVDAVGQQTGAFGMCCPSCAGRGVIGIQGGAMSCDPSQWYGTNLVIPTAVTRPGYYAGFSMPPQFVQGAPHGGSFRAQGGAMIPF